jgi:hypothetical protein
VQIPGIGKVTEQTLQALGVSTCSDLISHAALLTALLSDISSSSLIEAGLGLGATEHSSRGGGPGSSEPARKGISCERTFGAMSSLAEMEQMVCEGLRWSNSGTMHCWCWRECAQQLQFWLLSLTPDGRGAALSWAGHYLYLFGIMAKTYKTTIS